MQFVTAKRAADLTGLSERTIRRYVASGRIPARRLARNRLAISVDDLPTRWPTEMDDKFADLALQIDQLRGELKLAKARITALEATIRGRGEFITYQPVRAPVEAPSASQGPVGLPDGWVPAIEYLKLHGVSESTARRRLKSLPHHSGNWGKGVQYAFDADQVDRVKEMLGFL